MLIVLRIGGSVFASPLRPVLLKQYADLLSRLEKEKHKIVAVVGGGEMARELIAAGKQMGLTLDEQDCLAIHVSRLYALLLKLGLCHHDTSGVPASVSEVIQSLKTRNIVIMGGLKPGMTTDTVAALVAKKTHANLLVKATDQDGIYNKDPRIHRDAIKLDEMTYRELSQLLGKSAHEAGIHQILDPVAVRKLEDAKAKIIIVNGYNPQIVEDAINGKKVGTSISE